VVSQPPPTEVGLVFESLEASSRVAQLEAEIAQLKDALARAADRSGDRAGGPALGPSPRAGLVIGLYASPKTAIVKVATSLRPSSTRTAVDSAQQRSKTQRDRDAYTRRRTPSRCPMDGQQPTSESSQ
jgi:hypothetical protein